MKWLVTANNKMKKFFFPFLGGIFLFAKRTHVNTQIYSFVFPSCSKHRKQSFDGLSPKWKGNDRNDDGCEMVQEQFHIFCRYFSLFFLFLWVRNIKRQQNFVCWTSDFIINLNWILFLFSFPCFLQFFCRSAHSIDRPIFLSFASTSVRLNGFRWVCVCVCATTQH